MGRGEEGEVTSPFIGEFCEVSKAQRTRETQDGNFFGCFFFFFAFLRRSSSGTLVKFC